MPRTFPRKSGVPVADAQVSAMVNDLSPEGLCSLLCLSPYLQTRFRQMINFEYGIGGVQAAQVIEAWEADSEA